MKTLACCIVVGVSCGTLGWLDAHSTVAWECQHFGRFYVGEREFTCAVKEPEHGR